MPSEMYRTGMGVSYRIVLYFIVLYCIVQFPSSSLWCLFKLSYFHCVINVLLCSLHTDICYRGLQNTLLNTVHFACFLSWAISILLLMFYYVVYIPISPTGAYKTLFSIQVRHTCCDDLLEFSCDQPWHLSDERETRPLTGLTKDKLRSSKWSPPLT